MTWDDLGAGEREKIRCEMAISEYKRRIAALEGRIKHVDFMLAHGAEDKIGAPIEGYNQWSTGDLQACCGGRRRRWGYTTAEWEWLQNFARSEYERLGLVA